MCDFSKLTEQLFCSIPRLKAGQYVYVVASFHPAEDDVEIESIIYGYANDTPRQTLEDFCEAMSLDPTKRLCIPVVLPEGLKQEDAKGFKSVRQGASLHIEFTP